MKKQTYKLLVFVILTLGFWMAALQFMHSQNGVSISVLQDLRLATTGDGYYSPGTLDINFNAKLEGKQGKVGYLIVVPEVEVADLDYGYTRFAFGVGYAFNDWNIKNVHTSIYATYGFILRGGLSTQSFGLNGDITYKVSDRVGIVALAQFQERSDLKLMYGKGKIGFSGFIGINFKILR